MMSNYSYHSKIVWFFDISFVELPFKLICIDINSLLLSSLSWIYCYLRIFYLTWFSLISDENYCKWYSISKSVWIVIDSEYFKNLIKFSYFFHFSFERNYQLFLITYSVYQIDSIELLPDCKIWKWFYIFSINVSSS
jgi:hypothetical protein